MEAKRPLYWHQGLFLQPQHFQQMDAFAKSLAGPLYDRMVPYFWGIGRLAIQEASLAGQSFEIRHVEAVFQDGSWVSFPGNSSLRAIDLKEAIASHDWKTPLRIYLGLGKWSESGSNVMDGTAGQSTMATRFVCPADPETVKDLHGSGPPGNLRFLHYDLRLFAETQIAALTDYWLMPVAALAFSGSQVTLSSGFVPPVFSMDGSDHLVQFLRNIRERIANRARTLESYKLDDDQSAADIEGGYLRCLLALICLNRFLPLVDQLSATPVAHPWTVYGALRQMVGELSTFTSRIDALGRLIDGRPLLPDYDHKDLGRCFEELETLIGELLDAIVAEGGNLIHLAREDGRFVGQIPQEVFGEKNHFCLAVKTAEPKDRVIETVLHLAKAGSLEEMPALLSRALPGVSLAHRPGAPPGFPAKPDTTFFMLDRNHPQWQKVRSTETFCLYWPDAPQDVAADLVIFRA